MLAALDDVALDDVMEDETREADETHTADETAIIDEGDDGVTLELVAEDELALIAEDELVLVTELFTADEELSAAGLDDATGEDDNAGEDETGEEDAGEEVDEPPSLPPPQAVRTAVIINTNADVTGVNRCLMVTVLVIRLLLIDPVAIRDGTLPSRVATAPRSPNKPHPARAIITRHVRAVVPPSLVAKHGSTHLGPKKVGSDQAIDLQNFYAEIKTENRQIKLCRRIRGSPLSSTDEAPDPKNERQSRKIGPDSKTPQKNRSKFRRAGLRLNLLLTSDN